MVNATSLGLMHLFFLGPRVRLYWRLAQAQLLFLPLHLLEVKFQVSTRRTEGSNIGRSIRHALCNIRANKGPRDDVGYIAV